MVQQAVVAATCVAAGCCTAAALALAAVSQTTTQPCLSMYQMCLCQQPLVCLLCAQHAPFTLRRSPGAGSPPGSSGTDGLSQLQLLLPRAHRFAALPDVPPACHTSTAAAAAAVASLTAVAVGLFAYSCVV